jgi:ParB family transcriptional regulator, chromosome partitioning protein
MKSKNITSSAEEMKQKLFGQAASATEPSNSATANRLNAYRDYIGKTVTVPIDLITIEDNVRKQVDTTSPKFMELVDSIKREGILQNLIVDVRSSAEGTYLSCVSGQRRLLAARHAGVEKAVCLLKQYQNDERISIGLTENLVRQDLHCIDVAEGYAELHRNGWSEELIAERFERGQRTIHRYLLIAAWPEDVKLQIRQHPEIFSTRVIFNQFVSRGFADENDLRQAVEHKIASATNLLQKKSAQKRSASPLYELTNETKQSVKILEDKLQAGVKVKNSDGKGKIEISYQGSEDLMRILQILALS